MTEMTDETPTSRCEVCRRVEVSEHTYACPSCVGDVRKWLTQILELYVMLPAEVVHKGVHGEAFVLLGPAADPEARGHLEASVAVGRVDADMLEDGSGSHPLSTLGRLAMIVRDTLGHDELDRAATISGEADYLDGQLTTLSYDKHYDFRDLHTSVKACRLHLENVLHAGDRDEQGAPCPSLEHADEDRKPPRLVKKYNDRDPSGRRDEWACPRCGGRWSETDYRLRVAEEYRRHAKVLTASDMHREYDIKPGTLRQWVLRKKVEKRGTDGQGRQLYDVAQAVSMKNGEAVEAA